MKYLFLLTLLIAFSCGNPRAQNLSRVKPSGKYWKSKLPSATYEIMVNQGTEPPYHNKYWDNHEKGFYVSAATGDTLFTSDTKFDSHTGWPSFFKAYDTNKVMVVTDNSFGMVRDEVVEKRTGLHLGHLFNDGPRPTGLRYCMNSAALKFVKKK